jgi:hypothetical protein
MVTTVDVALVRPVALKSSVRPPAAPVMARSVKVATPLLLVVTGLIPPRVPPPVEIDAVTETPL